MRPGPLNAPLAAALLLAAAPSLAADAGAGGADAGAAERRDGIPEDRRPAIELSVEPREVAVGEVVSWRASIKRRAEDRVHLSGAASFGDLEVQGKDRTVGEPDGGWVVETLEVRLIGFEPGDFEIPAQDLTAVDADGNIADLEVPAASVRVLSLIANEPEPELRPDTGPGVPVLEKDYTPLYVLAVIGGAFAVALLTLLGRWLWSRRRPRPGPPPPPPRPAEEIALEKLAALDRSGLLDRGEQKQFHVLLSEAFREYLGNRYGFDSLERSTEELVGEMRSRRLEPVLHERVVELLEETDLVKFAKHLPGLGQSRDMLSQAFDVVHETTPRPAREEGGDA